MHENRAKSTPKHDRITWVYTKSREKIVNDYIIYNTEIFWLNSSEDTLYSSLFLGSSITEIEYENMRSLKENLKNKNVKNYTKFSNTCT